MLRMGRRGMVASPHYLATGAGLNVLRRGGSAVDAAIATNAVLSVVTPYLCGIGGDLFAQIYDADKQELVGLNGSGRAPVAATPERLRALCGGDAIPARGPLAVTVPGCVEAWGKLHERFGRLPFSELLVDAVTYARAGFPITSEFAQAVRRSSHFFHPNYPASETFLPRGEAPIDAEVITQPRIAATLETIAIEGAEAYYHGRIAAEIARSVQAAGGILSVEDLAQHRSEWVQPLATRYRDAIVYELPPNSQGIVALMMLNVLDRLPADQLTGSLAERIHLLAEVGRLAYRERERSITDPEYMRIDPRALLEGEQAANMAQAVGERASGVAPSRSPGDTAYLCTADGEGNLVSLIESNFMGFGSGVMAGETGVMLQNRGHWFSLDPEHINVIAPLKRTMHTLMPAMAFKQGRPWLVFGTMGGSSQPQIHVQVLTNLLDRGIKLDEALAAPRFDAVAGTDNDGRPLIELEPGIPLEVEDQLRERGHGVARVPSLGHAHAIEVRAEGVFAGASDPRTFSLALGF